MENILKNLFIVTLIVLTLSSCGLTNDDTTPSNEKEAKLYKGGFVLKSEGGTRTKIATLWEDDEPIYLSNLESWVNKIAVSGNDVYAVGRENQGSKSVAKLWKNGVASNPVSSAINTEALAVAVSATGDVHLLIHEWSSSFSEYRVIKNGNSIQLNKTNADNKIYPYDLFVSGSDIYVAGMEQGYGFTKAVYWINGAISTLPDASDWIANEASHILVFEGNTYILGYEIISNGNKVIVLWKNGIPSRITNGVKDALGYQLVVADGNVYIIGVEYDEATLTQTNSLWKNGTPIFTRTAGNYFFTSLAVQGDNWYVVEDGLTPSLWKNGTLEQAMPQDTYIKSIAVVEK